MLAAFARSKGDLMRGGTFRLLLGLVVLATAAWTFAPQPVLAQAGNKRIALVIGNSAYQNVTELTNPKNDATDITAKLKSLKFEVLLATDASHAQMATLLNEFKA